MAKLSTLLIANRGEIACRIMRTCRRLAIRTVAVYSEADADARHVRHADEAWPIGAAAPAASYLDAAKLIDAARLAGADAVHPGYGFLAENAAFAGAVREAGLLFVGPQAGTIALMGSKAASRQRMREAGVPVLPGYDDEDQSDEILAGAAERIGYPVLLKPSAGGGGKGMRVVHGASEFAAAAAAARREARGAFGDDRLVVEKYLVEPRHVEVQIVGDAHGNVVHLFERECSVQRRHQKIIEESPSPFLDAALRRAMAEAAVDAARAVDYLNAGTVEFIVDGNRQFYFMEMNTRLQVEHPVTEMITGIDLVEWQLRVAAGEPLPLAQERIACRGHAIECRLYAERPAQDFLPATGRIERFEHPPAGPGVRIDSGVDDGDRVTIHYDPMIAKLVTHAGDRAACIAAMRRVLAQTTVVGVDTNVALLGELLAHPRFRAGEVDTTFVDRELTALVEGTRVVEDAQLAAAAVRLLAGAGGAGGGECGRASPWTAADHWRASDLARRRLRFGTRDGRTFTVEVTGTLPALRLQLREDGDLGTMRALGIEVSGDPGREAFALALDGAAPRAVRARLVADRLLVQAGARVTELEALAPWPVASAAADEDIHPTAPMPGRVVSLEVAAGSEVAEGDALLTLEGMKMEYTVRARRAGVVEAVHCAVGDMVEAEVPLVSLREEP